MRILLVTPMLPLPVSGGRTRCFHLIRQLSERHELSVLCFVQPGEADSLPVIEPYCRAVRAVPWAGYRRPGRWRNRAVGWGRILFSRRPRYAHTFPVATMRQPLQALLWAQPFDLVVLDHLYLAELLTLLGSVPALLVEHNVESEIARRNVDIARHPVHRLRDRLIWQKLESFERHWLRCFRVCVAVSERDAALLRSMAPATEVYVVPNGVDSQSLAGAVGPREPERLLFFGTLNYAPNIDALAWFLESVWPEVRRWRPEVRLDVVGPDAGADVAALAARPGVNLVGFVPDVRPHLWSASLCVVPLRVGGGTRLKILEALAAGCPVLSTPVGVEGLDLVDRKHLWLATTAEEFAAAVVMLLSSDALRQELACAGQEAVAQHYDWRQIAPLFERACLEAIGCHSRLGSS